jgi:hypothetical protein
MHPGLGPQTFHRRVRLLPQQDVSFQFPVEMCEESEVSELSLLLHGLLVVCFFSGRFIV